MMILQHQEAVSDNTGLCMLMTYELWLLLEQMHHRMKVVENSQTTHSITE